MLSSCWSTKLMESPSENANGSQAHEVPPRSILENRWIVRKWYVAVYSLRGQTSLDMIVVSTAS